MWPFSNAQSEPMSKVDTAWLRMEQPTNLMMITGVIVFSEPVEYDSLLSTIEQRLLSFRRFRQKAVQRGGSAYWELDGDFDIRSHIRRTALPGAAGLDELEEMVSDLASTPLDQALPLWQFHLIENYQGGQALVSRFHHCIADGIALIQVLLSLTDPTPEPRPSSRSTQTWRSRRAAEGGVFQRLVEPARAGLDRTLDLGRMAIDQAGTLLRNPDKAAFYAREAQDIAAELASSIALSDDPPTPLKRPLGVRKRVAWAEPIPLAEVKAVCKALGCTVNDLLIAAVTGAVHTYLADEGATPTPDLEIRATVPVNLRPLEHAKNLGNHFGLVFLPLPVGEPNPIRRLAMVRAHMNSLKSSKQAAVAFGLLSALGRGPAMIQKPALDLFSRKATTVLTNVPGPQQALYLAGAELKEMMFWVPQNGTIGMGISILSYNNNVYFGLITDRKSVPEPKKIIRNFQPEFEKLLYLTLLADPDEVLDPEAAVRIAKRGDSTS